MFRPEGVDVRILADDLTGALDSAVAFAAPALGVGVTWRRDAEPGPRMAVDLATMEGAEVEAIGRHAALAPWLAGASLSFKKIDSLLRGHVAAEIGACLANADYERVIVAPAFPFQGRVTRAGRQWRLRPEMIVGPDLTRRLAASAALPGAAPPGRIVIYDAETDRDLDRIVETEVAVSTSILWIGTGGLAGALARHLRMPEPVTAKLSAPFVGLIGTDQETTAAQVRRFAAKIPDGHILVEQDVRSARKRLIARMARGQPSVVGVKTSGDRRTATRDIEEAFAALLDGLPPPGALFVTGGETLRALCERLGVESLVVNAAIEPGLPVSRMGGGSFDGVATISKSGAFGDADLLLRLSSDTAS